MSQVTIKEFIEGVDETTKKRFSERSLQFRYDNKNRIDTIFGAKFDQKEKFEESSAKIEITLNNTADRFLKTNDHIKLNEKIVECDAHVAVIDYTKYGYCVNCLGEVTKNYVICKRCHIVRFCSIDCKNKDQTYRFVCETSFHLINFGDSIVYKCAVQMFLKA